MARLTSQVFKCMPALLRDECPSKAEVASQSPFGSWWCSGLRGHYRLASAVKDMCQGPPGGPGEAEFLG